MTSNKANISIPLTPLAKKRWWIVFGFAVLLSLFGLLSVVAVLKFGLGILTLDQNVVWGILICNFVFWIGLSHAGTFISAILLLLKQSWRREIARLAEITTLITILIALLMPIIHLGKPELFYRIFPVRDTSGFSLLNTGSALVWDFYAILSYFLVSLLFFQSSLLPDWAQKAKSYKPGMIQKTYRFLSFGWVGSHTQWQLRQQVIFILALLITPLVISVHSIVSLDFALTFHPAWHSALFPLYFVIGALYSGFALVYLIRILYQKLYPATKGLSSKADAAIKDLVLFCALLLALIFFIEFSDGLNLAGSIEKSIFLARFTGHFGWWQMLMLIGLLVIPQLFWSKKVRSHTGLSISIMVVILISMWLERFIIIMQNAQISYVNIGQSIKLNLFDWGLIIGPIGWFLAILFLIIRMVPINVSNKSNG